MVLLSPQVLFAATLSQSRSNSLKRARFAMCPLPSLRLPCRDFYVEEKQAKVSIAMKPTLNSDSNVKELALTELV
jgi:hypothetical protein